MPSIRKSPCAKLMTRMTPKMSAKADAHEAVDAADQDAGRKRLQDVLGDDQCIHWYPFRL